MNEKSPLNGSVNLLAEAMKKVFTEAMQGVALEIREDVEGVERRINGSMAELKSELNTNMADLKDEVLTKIDQEGEEIRTGVYGQIAEQQKQIGQMKAKKSSPGP